jgi:hypothetical protein
MNLLRETLDLVEKNNSSDSILKMIFENNIPLSPKAFDRIFGERTKKLLHIHEVNSINNLIDLEGSKKTISAFHTWDDESEIFDSGATGIDLDDICVTCFEGNVVFDYTIDVYTTMDSQGRRWIVPFDIPAGEDFDLFKEISQLISKEFNKISEFELEELRNLFMKKSFSKISGKDKAKIIKDYFDISESVLKDYKRELEFKGKVRNYNETVASIKKIDKIVAPENVWYKYFYENYNGTNYEDLNLNCKEFKQFKKDLEKEIKGDIIMSIDLEKESLKYLEK